MSTTSMMNEDGFIFENLNRSGGRREMPEEIWTSSGFDENDTVEMGKTIEFSCPKGLSFSFDNDDFNPYDDR